MKRILSILTIFALLLSFLSCKKDYDIPVATFSLTENERVVLLDGEKASVIFSGTCSYQGTIDLITLKIGTNQSLTNASNYSSAVDSAGFSFRVDSLSLATTYYYCFVVDYGMEKDYQTETKSFVLEEPTPATIVVITDSVTNISYTTAMGWGSVSYDSLSTVTERGFCWSLDDDPDLNDSFVTDQENGSTVDSTVSVQFSVLMSDLISDTLYYARAYAKGDAEVVYGEVIGFRTLAQETPDLPEVTVDSILDYTVFCTVISDGGSEVSRRGVCLSQNGEPTVDDLSVSSETGGTGSYSCSLTDLHLEANTTYRLRAFATNEVGIAYSRILSFTIPQEIHVPIVMTIEVANVTSTTADVRNYVVSDGGDNVVARGTCWGTSMNPTLNDHYTVDGTGTGSFTSNLTDLTPGTTYYIRAYATNGAGTAYSDEDSFTTSEEVHYIIDVSANPSNGGAATGGGSFEYGDTCMVVATPAEGYTFSKWTENGISVSADPNYTFTVTRNRTLVAHFVEQAPNTYNINVSANPSNGGTVTGGGTYQQGQPCTVMAIANMGYEFLCWTENGTEVSLNASYSFTVTDNRMLVAQFQLQSYTVAVSASPSNGGTVSGGGTYYYGQTCTVQASANIGYTFANWTMNGNVVSTQPEYSFTVTGNCSMVAHFNQQSCTITVSADPTDGGIVTGGGTYYYGQSCTVHATANSGYVFANWTENGSVVSDDSNYTFTVTGNRTLVANFNVHQVNQPTVTTNAVTNITETTATCGGNVTSDGGADVTERGVCWNTRQRPTIDDPHTIDGAGLGPFISSITRLEPGVTYHVRAYAINSEGVAYGDDVEFTTSQEE